MTTNEKGKSEEYKVCITTLGINGWRRSSPVRLTNNCFSGGMLLMSHVPFRSKLSFKLLPSNEIESASCDDRPHRSLKKIETCTKNLVKFVT
jgi:hypothetical protein